MFLGPLPPCTAAGNLSTACSFQGLKVAVFGWFLDLQEITACTQPCAQCLRSPLQHDVGVCTQCPQPCQHTSVWVSFGAAMSPLCHPPKLLLRGCVGIQLLGGNQLVFPMYVDNFNCVLHTVRIFTTIFCLFWGKEPPFCQKRCSLCELVPVAKTIPS